VEGSLWGSSGEREELETQREVLELQLRRVGANRKSDDVIEREVRDIIWKVGGDKDRENKNKRT